MNNLCCELNDVATCKACGAKWCSPCVNKSGRIRHLIEVVSSEERFCPTSQKFVRRQKEGAEDRSDWAPFR